MVENPDSPPAAEGSSGLEVPSWSPAGQPGAGFLDTAEARPSAHAVDDVHTGAPRIVAAFLPHPGLKRAVEFVDQHYAETLNLDHVAAQASLSKYHFSRLFRRLVGMTFQDYLTSIRVAKAKQLLERTPYVSVTEIAHEAGFGSLRNFETRFKRFAGVTPSHYRANHRGATLFVSSAR